jgi:DNA-binding response OmpR family regulator
LPVLAAEAAGKNHHAAEAPIASASDSRYRTALMVEDEEAVLHLLRNILAERGYHVLTAVDGETAVKIFQHNKENIDVVLLDLDLPRISGVEVLRKIRAEDANARVVVTSGYLEPELKSALLREGVSEFIHKPYLPDEVVAVLETPSGPMIEEKENAAMSARI